MNNACIPKETSFLMRLPTSQEPFTLSRRQRLHQHIIRRLQGNRTRTNWLLLSS
jgi:hypothetical protein